MRAAKWSADSVASVDLQRHIASRQGDASLEQSEATALELMSFCRRLGVPFGINVESVSIRKVEIEASVRLAERLRRHLAR
jgi:hypothetical protein